MENKKTAVFGIYTTTNQAEAAVNQLMSQGFSGDDISVLMEDSNSSRQFAHEKNTKVPEGTTTGATAGGVIGGTLGLLAGLGALAIPGVGPLIAAGPIMGTLAGIGAGGTVGGLIGALVGVGIPEYEAKRYEGRVKTGGVLLSVHSDDDHWTRRAKQILEDTGAVDISSTSEAKADYAASERPMPRSRAVNLEEIREETLEPGIIAGTSPLPDRSGQ